MSCRSRPLRATTCAVFTLCILISLRRMMREPEEQQPLTSSSQRLFSASYPSPAPNLVPLRSREYYLSLNQPVVSTRSSSMSARDRECFDHPLPPGSYGRLAELPWMTKYAPWRNICSVEFEEWRRRIPAPVPLSPSYDQLMALPDGPRHEEFTQCLTRQAQSFSTRIPGYQSPDVWEVRRRVQAAKEAKGMNVTVVVFWGRRRYVSILVPYLERNLAVNGGVVDDVLLLVGAPGMDRDGPSVTTMDIINSLTSKYPGVMKALPMCKLKWTCAYNAYMTDKRTVYIKLDDDTVFIKDGTFEHLAYENLMSEDYLLYSANVVNHVWGNGVNHFAGAYPPSSFHWPTLGLNNNSLPLLSPEDALGLYWGFQLSTFRGSQAHDAFLTNVALGRLDVYTYDLWNMHECGGGLPQFGMPDYNTSFRRWSINAIAFTRTRCKSKILTRRDDEAFVSVNWPIDLEPHRVAFVGESLVVHAALLTQRNASHPFNFMGRFGMVEEWIIPVYTELARQYTSVPFGQWKGNLSFLDYYESVLVGLGQRLWSEDPWLHCKAGRSDWFAPHCKGIAVENVTGADIRSPVDRTSNASEHTTL